MIRIRFEEIETLDRDFDDAPDALELLEGIQHGHLNLYQDNPGPTIWHREHDSFLHRKPIHHPRILPLVEIPLDTLIDHLVERFNQIPWRTTYFFKERPPELAHYPRFIPIQHARDNLLRARNEASTQEKWNYYDRQLRAMREELGMSPEEFYGEKLYERA